LGRDVPAADTVTPTTDAGTPIKSARRSSDATIAYEPTINQSKQPPIAIKAVDTFDVGFP